jgi:hypothetical protein
MHYVSRAGPVVIISFCAYSRLNSLSTVSVFYALFDFQGGGGEKLKQKQKRLEDAERRNKELGGEPALKWSGDVS